MTTLKRIDPRRLYVITAAGRLRIKLGAVSDAAGSDGPCTARPSCDAPAKPLRTVRAARRTLLAVVHSERGVLDEHARQTVAAAALLADESTEVVLLVFGELQEEPAVLGADIAIECADFDAQAFMPERELQVLCACAAAFAPAHLLLPDNASGTGDLGRRYAAARNASVAAQVVEIDARQVGVCTDAKRAFAMRSLPDVVLLAPNAVEPKLPFVGAGQRRAPDFLGVEPQSSRRYRDCGLEHLEAAQVALEEADCIIAAGHGVTDIRSFERLAGLFGAAVGASRIAVDNGHFTRDKQVGATGKTVSASLYIAFGISGAVQHLQGIKDCRHVIAVNLDAGAPIAQRADLLVVGDADATVAALIEQVEAARLDVAPARAKREGIAA